MLSRSADAQRNLQPITSPSKLCITFVLTGMPCSTHTSVPLPCTFSCQSFLTNQKPCPYSCYYCQFTPGIKACFLQQQACLCSPIDWVFFFNGRDCFDFKYYLYYLNSVTSVLSPDSGTQQDFQRYQLNIFEQMTKCLFPLELRWQESVQPSFL